MTVARRIADNVTSVSLDVTYFFFSNWISLPKLSVWRLASLSDKCLDPPGVLRLFAVVPAVLARKRRPPPRPHPGGICVRRPGRGHHQQNIPHLQRSTGKCKKTCSFFFLSLSCLFATSLFSSPSKLFCPYAPHTSHSVATICPFKLCRGRGLLFFDACSCLFLFYFFYLKKYFQDVFFFFTWKNIGKKTLEKILQIFMGFFSFLNWFLNPIDCADA